MRIALLRAGSVALALAALLSSCSKPRPADDKPFIDALGFDTPVSLTVALDGVTDANGNPLDYPNAHALSHLIEIGYLKAAASMTSPYFVFEDVQSHRLTGNVAYTIGTRVLEGRSGETSDERGSTSYFGETVSYSIKPTHAFASAYKALDGLTFSLVLRFDKTSGTWVQDGASFDAHDIQVVLPQFTGGSLDALRNAITAAREQAFDAIEHQLAQNGVLVRDANSGVVTSPRMRLVYHLSGSPIDHASLVEAEQACLAETAGGKTWHLARRPEFAGILNGNVIIDTPDGRIWGGAGGPTSGGWRNILLAPDASDPGTIWEWQVNSQGGGGWNSFFSYGNPAAHLDGIFLILCASAN